MNRADATKALILAIDRVEGETSVGSENLEVLLSNVVGKSISGGTMNLVFLWNPLLRAGISPTVVTAAMLRLRDWQTVLDGQITLPRHLVALPRRIKVRCRSLCNATTLEAFAAVNEKEQSQDAVLVVEPDTTNRRSIRSAPRWKDFFRKKVLQNVGMCLLLVMVLATMVRSLGSNNLLVASTRQEVARDILPFTSYKTVGREGQKRLVSTVVDTQWLALPNEIQKRNAAIGLSLLKDSSSQVHSIEVYDKSGQLVLETAQ